MTLEEMAGEIRAGRTELLVDLWKGCRRFVYKQAYKWAPKLARYGVDVEDLAQAGFIAAYNCATCYSIEAGAAFLSYLAPALKREFKRAAGICSKRGMNDPINTAASLNETPPDMNDGITRADTVASIPAADDLERAENRIYNAGLRPKLEALIDTLPEAAADHLRRRYCNGEPLALLAQHFGITETELNKRHAADIRRLRAAMRHSSAGAALRAYMDSNTNYYQTGSKNANPSRPVEDNVIRRASNELRQLYRETSRADHRDLFPAIARERYEDI